MGDASMTNDESMSRRGLLAGGVAGGVALLSGAAAATTAAVSPRASRIADASLRGPTLDLMTPQGNLRATARLQGNLDMKSDKYTWYDGVVSAVVPGRQLRDLFGFRGMAASRLVPLETEPGYRLLNREFGVYYDLATRQTLDTWINPLADETVKVVHLTNDPVNHVLREWVSPPPVDRAAAAMKLEKRPLQFAWRAHGDRLLMSRRVHLFYPNALDPKVWVRESSGPMVQASEYTSWNMSLEDMQDPALQSIDAIGNWTRVTPWLPWMLMGDAPGHCLYETFISKVTRYEQVPADIRADAEQRFPLFLKSPEKFVEGSGSSLENYARMNKPAPPRAR
jgi:hypothetical protein